MGKINVLSFAVANLIAAGEVVDRPASVIKELMENSIDSGADSITVEIQKGGTVFMRVSDNGCGIEKDDLPTALRRHATSKIKEASDLDSIMSLGFRGEALAAISSVSNVRIISKTRDNSLGAMVESRAGNIVGVTERGASDGTTVIVEDLFYNVPARRKFLKKDVTEAMAVAAAVEKIALSHPEIAIRFISDGVTRLETSGDGKAMSAIYSVFGRDFAAKMLELEPSGNEIRVSGYIGRSDNVRANRNYQNFFINGRYVKSKTAMAAIEQAYASYIPPEKFPCCVLFIDIDPRTVDVNVHPAKLEVKFSNEKLVFESVYYTVRNTLEKNITRPEVSLQNGRISAAEYRNMATGNTGATKTNSFDTAKRQNPLSAFVPIADKNAPKPEQIRYDAPPAPRSVDTVRQAAEKEEQNGTFSSPAPELTVSVPKVLGANNFAPKTEVKPEPNVPYPIIETGAVRREILPGEVKPAKEEINATEQNEKVIPPYRIIGEAFNSYIFVDLGEKMLIIDKHAAHERIIFERFKEIMRGREQASQMLMLPIEVSLGSDECAALKEYKSEIESAGFTFSVSQNKVSVHSLPTGIASEAVPDIFETFAERLLSGTGNVSLTRDLIFEKALYQASCKAAIKAGRQYAEGHIEWLCRKMMEMPDITFCPHGRPVAIEMTKNTLDKQFERL
ncbi:MAG: DNA mismatch repair endonuclease MutL [Ruminococcaceae bacterium]|nr:DNA mismatch repair endonuclease MutL [Oscillospiraceae bacterium]